MSFKKMRTLIVHQVALIETGLKYLENFDNLGDKASLPRFFIACNCCAR